MNLIYWQSWADFWAMGGYAFYVWSSVGLLALSVFWEVWQVRRQFRAAYQRAYSLTGLPQSITRGDPC